MARIPFFRRTFRITRFKADAARDVHDEIEVYLEMRTHELIDQGMDPAEARRSAESAFGDRRQIEAECQRLAEPMDHSRQRTEMWSSLVADVRHAFRDMRKRPALACTACLTLAVCIALNAAVFGVVRSVVLKPLPFADADRIVTVLNSYPNAGTPRSENSAPDYFDRRQHIEAFEDVALYQTRTRSIGEPGSIQRAFSLFVTPSFFNVIGVEPVLGRAFSEAESEPGEDLKAILGFDLWQQLFGGDPTILGRQIRIEGTIHTVVGVMPKGFEFPSWDAELWLPLAFTPWQKSDQARHNNGFHMLARLRPEATAEQAQDQLEALNQAVLPKIPADFRQRVIDAEFTTLVRPFHDDLIRDVKPWLMLLWAGALFVLLIGGISLTNLLLVRSSGRLQELATRYVLGAGHGRLARQLLTESLVLALLGGSLGLLGALWALHLFKSFHAYEIPRAGEIGLDLPSMALILALSLVIMALSSAVGLVAVQRRDLFSMLRSGSSTSGGGRLKLRGALVAAQVAVAFMLAIGAGLTFFSLRQVMGVNPGFDTDGVLGGALILPSSRYPDVASQHQFFDRALADISRLPGINSVAVASQLPFSGHGNTRSLTPEGKVHEAGETLVPHYRTAISSDYFSLMGIPLLAGRTFRNDEPQKDADGRPMNPVVIISQEVEERYWPGGALGQRVYLGTDPDEDAIWHTVVGVVGDIVQNDLTDATSRGAFYVPYRDAYLSFTRLAIRAESNPRAMTPSLRERIFTVDPEMAFFWTETLDESIASTLLSFRVPMRLFLIFAGVALALAAVGVYGVLAQSVAQRTKEISIRMALGSSRSGIYRWTLRGMLVFVAVGLALGLCGALSLTHLMRGLLYGVGPTDPVVFGLVGLLIGGVAFMAAVVPAQRATRIDPVRALDAE